MKPHPKEDQKEGRGLGQQEKKIIIIKKGKGEFLLGMSHNTMWRNAAHVGHACVWVSSKWFKGSLRVELRKGRKVSPIHKGHEKD